MNSKAKVTTIDLLRHGECENGRCFRGWIDVALSDLGWQQMHDSLQNTAPSWDRVVSSSLMRCADFAQVIADKHSLPLAVYDSLREVSFGDWEGQRIDHIWQTQPEQANTWYNNPEAFTPPNGEPVQDFYARVSSAFTSIVTQHEGEQLLLVVHGGVIRVLMAHCLSIPFNAMHRIDVPYACLSRLQMIHDEDKQYLRCVAHNMSL